MKNLVVTFTSLTLLLSLCTRPAQAQPQQDQPPGGNQYPLQRMNGGNNIGGDDIGPGPEMDRQGGPGPNMDRQSSFGGNQGMPGSGPDSGPGSMYNRFNQGGAAGNGQPGGGPGMFQRFGGGAGGQGRSPQEMAERRQRMMKRFDTNGDGVLDDTERAKMRAYFQQRRQSMQNGASGGGGYPNQAPQGGPSGSQ